MQEEIFGEAKKFLMEPEIWTYGNMLGYQRKAGRDMHPVLRVGVLASKSPSWFGDRVSTKLG